MTTITAEKANQLKFEAAKVFTPSAPIDSQALFAGRIRQIDQIVDAIGQRGQHVIVFGERGVGKTSLANILTPLLHTVGQAVIAPRINCDGTDTFASVWKKMFTEIKLTRQKRMAGFGNNVDQQLETLADATTENVTPGEIRSLLASVAGGALLILIFDEFDRITDNQIQRLFADTIKSLSDHSVPVTIVLVGVADTVDQLIQEHLSAERALVQIHMTRMSPQELVEIIDKGLNKLEMTIDTKAKERISRLSQGLPHYTHSLGLHSSRMALDNLTTHIESSHVDKAIDKAVGQAHQTIRDAYRRATTSAKKNTLYADVLLACAQAETDEYGYFSASDIREPLRQITSVNYDIPNYAPHLNNLCDESRGPVLYKTGVKRRFRFRFKNPLMQPFVTMKGFSDGKIKDKF